MLNKNIFNMNSQSTPCREVSDKVKLWFEKNQNAIKLSANNEQITRVLQKNFSFKSKFGNDNIIELFSFVSDNMIEIVTLKFDIVREKELFREGKVRLFIIDKVCKFLCSSSQHRRRDGELIAGDFSDVLL